MNLVRESSSSDDALNAKGQGWLNVADTSGSVPTVEACCLGLDGRLSL